MDNNELPQRTVPPASLGPVEPYLAGRNVSSRLVLDADYAEVDALGQLRATWDTLLKHQWLILATTALLCVLVAIYSFKMKPVYQSTARADIEPEVPILQTLNDLFRQEESDASESLGTQISILQSDALIWKTIQDTGMAGQLPTTQTQKSEGQVVGAPPWMKNAMIADFKGRLQVEQKKDTRIVLVTFESTDPRQAALAANTLLKNYIENNFRAKYDATRQATGWMEQRLDELKLKVEQSQAVMVSYERQNNIVNLGEKQTVTEQRFEDMSKDLSQAQSDRLSKESLYNLVAKDNSEVSVVQAGQGSQGNNLLGVLEAKEAGLREEYAEALAQYGPAYPKVLRLQQQINDEEALISRERGRIVKNIHNEYVAALQREHALAAAVAEQKAAVDRVNQLLIEHNILKRDFDSNQQLYDSLLQRLKDATVSAGLQATNIHVVDEATVPSTPVRPNKSRNIEFALAAGLALGIALALIKEALNTSIMNALEMEKLIGLPALAIVPLGQSTQSMRGHRSKLLDGIGGRTAETYAVELAVIQRPEAAISEAFRALRTAVLLSTAEHPPQMVLITSPAPSEGKTATSLNLAAALAQKGSRVLLLDADMRRPRLPFALNLSNRQGLSDMLSGSAGFDATFVQKVDALDNLFLLASGPRPPNPAELLCSRRLEMLLAWLRQGFDHVIVDSPPVLPVTDSTILSTLVDGVIMVVACESTSRAALTRACRVVEHSGGRILGTVFNKVDATRDGYSGYQYYKGYYTQENGNGNHREDKNGQPAA